MICYMSEEIDEDFGDLDKQNKWFQTYKLDPIKLGYMCEEYPALQKSWNEFMIIYNLCNGLK